jgi:hypothetical protein
MINSVCRKTMGSNTNAPHRGRPTRTSSLVLLLCACASNSLQAVEVTIPLPKFGPNNYAECVLKQINPDIGPVATLSIKSECRSTFPKSSSRGIFGPRSTESCYQKNEYRVAHRQASEAVFGACQDYFRANTASNSALRGGRLSP